VQHYDIRFSVLEIYANLEMKLMISEDRTLTSGCITSPHVK